MPLRQRNPFSADDAGAGEDDLGVLDEQEQEEVIHHLKAQTEATNTQYTLAAQLLLSVSTTLQLIYVLTHSPPTFLVVLTFLIHLNLFLYLLPPHIRKGGTEIHLPRPLSFRITYALSGIAPTLYLFIGHSWQSVLWWCTTPAMVYATQAVKMSVYDANESISTLESLKYHAPGA